MVENKQLFFRYCNISNWLQRFREKANLKLNIFTLRRQTISVPAHDKMTSAILFNEKLDLYLLHHDSHHLLSAVGIIVNLEKLERTGYLFPLLVMSNNTFKQNQSLIFVMNKRRHGENEPLINKGVPSLTSQFPW